MPFHLLILGGGQFLGRHLTQIALAQGHTVTLFNRGKTNPHLFPEAERLIGDRVVGDLTALQGREWDAVIDTCGYVPRVVRQAVDLLADHIDHYTFISSLSVYSDNVTPNQDETAPLATLEDETTEQVNGETYGGLKVLCERVALDALPGRSLIIRPGLIVGPHDPTDRFTYWPARLARGGDILAPGDPAAPVQFIDVRDLAEWTLHLVEHSISEVFNATGPAEKLTFGDFLTSCQATVGRAATPVWVDEAFLLEQGVAPYTEMPLWVPAAYAGFNSARFQRALHAGLTHRPLTDTIQDTLAWQATRPANYTWRAGLTPEREAELLNRWRTQPASA